MSFKLFINNDNVLEVSQLTNTVTKLNLNAANATVTIGLAATSANISGETWPLSLSYVTGSSGQYRATLKDTLVVTENTKYIGTLIIDAGGGLRGQWVLPIIVRDRRPPN